MSTKVAVMNRGFLQQVSPPQEIYKRPSNLFVADFIGSPTINFIPGRVIKRPEGFFLESEVLTIPAPSLKDCISKRVVAAIRPEDIRLCKERQENSVPAEVYAILPAGADVILQVKRENLTLSIREIGEVSLEVGDQVHLLFSVESVLFYDQEDRTLLYPSE
jgi:multiple sugar transport system ATP-binding protein